MGGLGINVRRWYHRLGIAIVTTKPTRVVARWATMAVTSAALAIGKTDEYTIPSEVATVRAVMLMALMMPPRLGSAEANMNRKLLTITRLPARARPFNIVKANMPLTCSNQHASSSATLLRIWKHVAR